jgi:hypothetical protein
VIRAADVESPAREMSASIPSRRSLFVAVNVAGQLLAALCCGGFIVANEAGRTGAVRFVTSKTLSRPEPAGEVIDVTTQVVRKERKYFSRIKHFARRCTCLRRCLADAGDVSGDYRGAL